MRTTRPHLRVLVAATGIALSYGCAVDSNVDSSTQDTSSHFEHHPNATGVATTFSTQGKIDRSNPFFQSLGVNGRSCASCHAPEASWTITPEYLQALFERTQGMDPIFNTLDTGNSPDALPGYNVKLPPDQQPVSYTLDQKRAAFSTLLDHAVVRFSTSLPAGADFTVTKVDDPYGWSNTQRWSRFRRPGPAVNMKFLSIFTWSGAAPATDPATGKPSMHLQLFGTCSGGSIFHAQRPNAVPADVCTKMADFLMSIYETQMTDNNAGALDAQGATGGPLELSNQDWYPLINDNFGRDPQTHSFTQDVFDVYDPWNGATDHARAAVARGQDIFNHRAFTITGVGGLNDVVLPGQTQVLPAIPGITCSTCHDSPDVGTRSAASLVDIGVADGSRRAPWQLLITVSNNATGATRQVTDLGRAATTGKWADIGKMKGAMLRALAARSAYFHDGSAQTLEDVVNFYNGRFGIGLSDHDKSDLVAFLQTL